VATARNSEQLVEVASKFRQTVRTVSLDVTKETQDKHAVDTASKSRRRASKKMWLPGSAPLLNKMDRAFSSPIAMEEL